jgi:hypothetical protein
VYFRFPQQYVAVLNLFLIGIIVYFLALAVSNGIKLRLAKADLAHFSEVQRPQHSNPQQAELQPPPIMMRSCGVTFLTARQWSCRPRRRSKMRTLTSL